MQWFKGDDDELVIFGMPAETINFIGGSLTEFFDDCYNCVPMGELLWDNDLVPLKNAIKREIFIGSFQEIFNAWALAGTFESYITVFKKIFGDEVQVTFTVPAPGKLEIDIVTTGVQIKDFVARRIFENQFVYDLVKDLDGNQFVFTSVKGFESEFELKQMLYATVPNGIFTTVSLTIDDGDEEE